MCRSQWRFWWPVLGIVNTLTVSITDRRRELGVLQAVGGLRNQIRGTIWLEALAVGIVGLILGLALGALQLYYSLHISAEDMAGLRLSYEYPYPIALLLLAGHFAGGVLVRDRTGRNGGSRIAGRGARI